MLVFYNHLGPEGNYLEEFGPYLLDHYKTLWGKGDSFLTASTATVLEFFYPKCPLLVSVSVDGLRLDAIHGIYDKGAKHSFKSFPRGREILQSPGKETLPDCRKRSQ